MLDDWRQPAPGVVRVESGGDVMLYDPYLAGNLTADWFEPARWRASGAVTGTARGRGETVFFEAGGHEFALRHCRRGGLVAKFVHDRYFCPTESVARPLQEFLLTHRLWRHGLPVAPAAGVRLQRRNLWCRGDLLTRRIAGAQTLAERLVQGPVEVPVWIAVGRMLGRFHGVGLCHADLNAHNVLFDAHGAAHLIDFDRGTVRARGLWCDANLVRLRRSILKICDAVPAPRFNETLWAALLAGYRDAAANKAAAGTA